MTEVTVGIFHCDKSLLTLPVQILTLAEKNVQSLESDSLEMWTAAPLTASNTNFTLVKIHVKVINDLT